MAECLIHGFLGRHVLVEVDGCQIPGKLLSYHEGSGNVKPHKPSVLVVQTPVGRAIVRGSWQSIGMAREVIT